MGTSGKFVTLILQPSAQVPQFVRKIAGRQRAYLRVENRDTHPVIMTFDEAPNPDGTGGIAIPASGVMLFEQHVPDNDVIWFLGSNGGNTSQLNITESYR